MLTTHSDHQSKNKAVTVSDFHDLRFNRSRDRYTNSIGFSEVVLFKWFAGFYTISRGKLQSNLSTL